VNGIANIDPFKILLERIAINEYEIKIINKIQNSTKTFVKYTLIKEL